MAVGAPDVTAEDQQKINSFNKRWQRLKEINAELEGRSKMKEDCEDASNELMLVDEEEVRFVMGECFYHSTVDEAEEKLGKLLRDVQVEQDRLNEEASNLKAGMAELKKVLYGKFGSSINLEE